MTHMYQLTGMTCSGCETLVKTSLLAQPGIKSAEVSKESCTAILNMSRHISLHELTAALGGKKSKFQIQEMPSAQRNLIEKAISNNAIGLETKWYNFIAPVYDRAIRKLYLPYRLKLINSLQLEPGQTVLDLGCGSGLNFELIMLRIGSQGTLVGVDSSMKMIERARLKVNKHGWKNVYLLQQDARELNIQSITEFRIDSVLCTLGFSVFPNWELVFEKSYGVLASDGRYGIMDLYNKKSTFQTQIVNFLANSDISRKVWEPLQKRVNNYSEERLPIMHGTEVVVIASGQKP